MLSKILESNLINVLWPIYYAGKVFPGTKFAIIKDCGAECLQEAISTNTVCKHGYFVVRKNIEDEYIYIIGRKDNSKLSKAMRKEILNENSISKWFEVEYQKISTIIDIANEEAKKNFDQFHELSKWVKSIEHHAEKLIFKRDRNGNICSSFDKAPNDLKKIYKSSILLVDSLESSEIYFNPASARFGAKKLTDIYRVVDKFTKILEFSGDKTKRFKISGHVAKEYKVYESFKIIILSLLQNAQKYNCKDNIEINFVESENQLVCEIVTKGDCLSDEDIGNIFLRGFRVNNIKKTHRGSGLGLYITKIIADAHEFRLGVRSIETQEVGVFRNMFSVAIH